MLPSAAELVAQFLRSNGYTETLQSFVKEANLPPDCGTSHGFDITIETILQEKKTFDVSLKFEKLGIGEDDQRWIVPAPDKATVIQSLPNRSNILSVSVLDLLLATGSGIQQYIVVTTADRQLHILDPASMACPLVRSFSGILDSPSLDVLALNSNHVLIASMSGALTLFDMASGATIEKRTDHGKYLVKLVIWHDRGSCLVASAGWDAKILVYRINTSTNSPRLGDPIAVLALPSIPETMAFVESPKDGRPILLVARRDSTFLHYYTMPIRDHSSLELIGKQNLAPHSNAWVAFTPADIQLCPTDPNLAAIATSSTPHMKLIIVKLHILSLHAPSGPDRTEAITQASQARSELLIADREEAAILVNVSTLAPQTSYSTPRIVWRPDGSGVYVSSDDGIVRGLEAKTGKLIASLEAHDPGSKLRCLSAGYLRPSSSESMDLGVDRKGEYLVSGGFDQKLVLWTCSGLSAVQ